MMHRWFALAGFALALAFLTTLSNAGEKAGRTDNVPPKGFTALFNGTDLTGWQGLVPINKRKKMSKEQYEDAGLITIDPEAIRVTSKGRLFVRASGMVFDKYLGQPTTSTYSKLI